MIRFDRVSGHNALDLGSAAQAEAVRDDERRLRVRNWIAGGGLIVALAVAAVWRWRRER